MTFQHTGGLILELNSWVLTCLCQQQKTNYQLHLKQNRPIDYRVFFWVFQVYTVWQPQVARIYMTAGSNPFLLKECQQVPLVAEVSNTFP